MLTRIVIDHFERVARGMRDEHAPGFGIECGVVEGAIRSTLYIDDAKTLQGHGDLASLRRREQVIRLIDRMETPSTCNLLEIRALHRAWTV
jgi:hypothetical protein